MPTTRTVALILCLGLLGVAARQAAAQDVFGIPLKPDPPFAVDGDLSEWSDVPNALTLDQADQVVWGATNWTSPEDMSGTARLAWRREHLYVAVAVVDDQLRQTQRAQGLWKGDHIEIYLDAQPEVEPQRDAFGQGQFQLGFSPGNFRTTGDPLVDCAPDAYCFRPPGTGVEGVLVAATQTATGWTLEAAVPWTLLGIDQPEAGMLISFELGISDTDTPEPQQESLMTTSTAAWVHKRSRLTLAALAGADGVATPAARCVDVLEALVLEHGAERAFTFNAPEIPADREAILTLQARLHSDKVAGYHPALRITLNDQTLAADRLINKPLRVISRGGRVFSMAAGDRFATYYTPDFKRPDTDPHYGLLGGVKACSFELKATDLVRQGENVLVIENAAVPSVDNPLHVENVRLAFRMPPSPPKEKAGPPTGPLPRIEPRATLATDYALKPLPDGQIEVSVHGETFLVSSRFSTPGPGWVQGTCPYFRLDRQIEEHPEALLVRDTFTNLTPENLALMHRHEIALGERLDGLWLGGFEQPSGAGSTAVPANATSYAATAKRGVGFLALDDVFRVHVANYAVNGSLGIADNNLVLAPNATYTAEWAVIPTAAPDYWRFINTARRLIGANFTIEGCFAFLRAGPLTDAWSDEQIAGFLRFKDADYACASISYPRYKGHYSHGTAFQRVTHDNYRNAFARWKRLVPEIQTLVYFHCFLDVTEEGPERFADARTLRPNGTQANYGEDYYKLYFPTETNAYGPEIAKSVDIILDEIKADGVYWDEHEYSRWGYHYGAPWDGYSGDIDPKTMTVSRLKSSVTLLSEPWRVALAKRIMARGPLVGNGAPFTRAMVALKFPCFIETGSITNCTRGHLYSPIALGDHLTERSELDAYRVMLAALDYGCVYHWYNDVNVIPTHHTLTRYMYPITPLELHEGYVIGRERIITKKSGLFGWADDAQHEVHVFDDTGTEVDDFDAPLVQQDGKTYSELRIAEDWSAAILRKTAIPHKDGS